MTQKMKYKFVFFLCTFFSCFLYFLCNWSKHS